MPLMLTLHVSLIFPSCLFPTTFPFVPVCCSPCYCLMKALRRLVMLCKCHNGTDPVIQNDCLLLRSNASLRLSACVVLVICECLNTQPLDQGSVHSAGFYLDRVFGWRAQIMN